MAPQTGSIVLNNGDSMPIIGLGTWQAPKGEVGAAVRVAIENGYRHVDCAACYGNEAEIGEVFADLFARGVVKREELFVTSSCGTRSTRRKASDPPAKTLKDLQLDYLDLYLIHWPQNFAKEVEGNCSFPRNDDGSMRYDVETTSADTWRRRGILPRQGISLTAYSPLGTGATIDGMTVVGNPVLAAIGEAHGKSAAQVAIAWLAQRGLVVIPKSVTAARVVANRDVDFALTPEDMAKPGVAF
ncbi:oxidoreductase [Aureococcus anophagefferens]|nr:oxidoreductase [Aureococcus anophagefferens]